MGGEKKKIEHLRIPRFPRHPSHLSRGLFSPPTFFSCLPLFFHRSLFCTRPNHSAPATRRTASVPTRRVTATKKRGGQQTPANRETLPQRRHFNFSRSPTRVASEKAIPLRLTHFAPRRAPRRERVDARRARVRPSVRPDDVLPRPRLLREKKRRKKKKKKRRMPPRWLSVAWTAAGVDGGCEGFADSRGGCALFTRTRTV